MTKQIKHATLFPLGCESFRIKWSSKVSHEMWFHQFTASTSNTRDDSFISFICPDASSLVRFVSCQTLKLSVCLRLLFSASTLKNFLFAGDVKAELSNQNSQLKETTCSYSGKSRCVLSTNSALSFLSSVLVF